LSAGWAGGIQFQLNCIGVGASHAPGLLGIPLAGFGQNKLPADLRCALLSGLEQAG